MYEGSDSKLVKEDAEVPRNGDKDIIEKIADQVD